MKKSKPGSAEQTEVPDERNHKDQHTEKLDHKDELQEKNRHSDDASYPVVGDRRLHKEPAAQSDFFLTDHGSQDSYCCNPQTTCLNQTYDDPLPEQTPEGDRILRDQTGHANGRGRGEQCIGKRESPAFPRKREHQKQCPGQNDAHETDDNDLKR